MRNIDRGDTNLGGPFIYHRVGGPGSKVEDLRIKKRKMGISAEEEEAEDAPRRTGRQPDFRPGMRHGLRTGIVGRKP